MIVYRLSKSRYKNDLSGNGAKLYGGRWNSEGIPMIYASGSVSLCILEYLVHVSVDLLPSDLELMHLEIPKASMIKHLPSKKLPKDWQEYPFPHSTRSVGDEFIQKNKALVLKVPSVIVPNESNYLINPLHKDAKSIKIVHSEAFQFDLRLLQ